MILKKLIFFSLIYYPHTLSSCDNDSDFLPYKRALGYPLPNQTICINQESSASSACVNDIIEVENNKKKRFNTSSEIIENQKRIQTALASLDVSSLSLLERNKIFAKELKEIADFRQQLKKERES